MSNKPRMKEASDERSMKQNPLKRFAENSPAGQSCETENKKNTTRINGPTTFIKAFGNLPVNRRSNAFKSASFGTKTRLDGSKTKFGFRKLENLSKEQDSLKVAIEMANTFNGFEFLLGEESFLKERPDWIILITQLLALVCKCEFPENRIKVLNVVFESQFIELIIDCLYKLSTRSDKEEVESFLKNAYILIETLVDTFPNVSKEKLHAPVRQIFGSISSIQEFAHFQIDASIKTDFTKLECRIRDMQTAYANMLGKGKKHLDKGEPPENFRTFELYPYEEEILIKKDIFLRRNIVDGRYENVEHYLDVQFRLLREDLLIPLREGFRDLIDKLSDGEEKKMKVNHLRYFQNCCLGRITTDHGTVSYDICFDVDRKLNHINWEYNRWFKYGSLLFISFDKFSSFIIGKVANKNNAKCEEIRVISVELLGEKEIREEYFDKSAMMVESEILFEPYYHVMRALKQFNDVNFPLARYIVEVNPNIQIPAYLKDNSLMKIGDEKINVLDDHVWPSAEQLSLDSFQYEAFKSAITKELVIIQGPPGTGKTFLGLKIVEALHDYNTSKADKAIPPILVVCYTNHALDQFLEGILKFTEKVVRVGSRTKSEKIKNYELSTMRHEFPTDRSLKNAFFALKNEISDIIEQIKMIEGHLDKIPENQGIISYEFLAPFMSRSHQDQLRSTKKLTNWLLLKNYLKFTNNAAVRGYKLESIHKPRENPYNDSDEDEVRQQCLNADNIIADIIDTFAGEDVKIHAIDIRSLSKEKILLKNQRSELENEYDIQSGKYAKKKWQIESDIDGISSLMKVIGSQLKKVSYCNSQDVTTEFSILKTLDIDARWKLYSQWVGNLKCGLRNSIKTLEEKVRGKLEQLEESKQLVDVNILKRFSIVGMTTTAAARNHLLLTVLKPNIVVVEEAAEVLEAHIVTSLTEHCEQLILIGDHQQLRPNPTVYKLAKQYSLEVSLFERMINNKLNFSSLGVQHRMRPEICDLITPSIYPNLQNHCSVYNFDSVKGVTKNLFFLTHEVSEEMDNNIQSYKNSHECDFALQLAQYLLQQGYASEHITILTTYSAQLIYLKMKKEKTSLLRNVRISTVDDYQGEESRIILLSLVRSNTDDKIGFLKISNRVCVALSRAREGLYMIGNMKILAENSDIWKPIKNKLEDHESIGSQLELECLKHGNRTFVSKKKDFDSVPEGGCSVICNSFLNCGHQCVKSCHPLDRDHKDYLCQKTCVKTCSEGHPCMYKCNQCSDGCKPCHVVMKDYELQCGHMKDIQCFKIKSHQCKEKVEAHLEFCGHSVRVTCYARTSGQAKCTKPCDIRLPCGHQCTLTCHRDEDPDHLEYRCMKACLKPMKGCLQNHSWMMLCFQPSPVCNEIVTKKLECGHEQQVPCHLDTVECLARSSKILECGHPCQKQCKEKCGGCSAFVEKKIPDCGHTINIKCTTTPTSEQCQQKCRIQLPCSHLCSKKCNEICSSTDECIEMVTHHELLSLCSHGEVQVPCMKRNLSEEILQDLALVHCKHPCGVTLLCGHVCKGTCGECQQSRFHKICNEKCDRVLICGHECKSNCSSTCPPCQAQCVARCTHAVCKHPCNEMCDPCFAWCDYQCKHEKCRLLCWDTCSRQRCYIPCREILNCGHRCIGFCGEPCPDKCRFCDANELTTKFFGSEAKKNARFVVLEDCGHFFESDGIEKYFGIRPKTSSSQTMCTEIAVMTCPKCKTPILSTFRFMNKIKFVRRNLGPAKILFQRKSLSDKSSVTIQKQNLIERVKKIIESSLNTKSRFFNEILSRILSSLSMNAKGRVTKFVFFDR